MKHIAVSFLWVWLSSTLIDGTTDGCYSSSKDEEDRLCDLAVRNNRTFCPSAGPADESCQSIASGIGGSASQCADSEVCSFVLNGGTAHVTCNAQKSGYKIQRNCVHNFGIACPSASADLSDTSRMINITGKEGCGVHEATTLADSQICNLDTESSIYYCESQTLRDDIILHFHPEKRLGDLCGGVCMDIRNSTDETNFKEVIRCVLAGTYMTESGQRDTCRFHLYNQRSKVFAVAYWGSANLVRLEDVA